MTAGMATTWESINEGDELQELRKTPSLTDLVRYSAGSGDFNPLHHDYNFPQSKLLGTIIVHGRYKYAALGELVSNWLGHGGRIKKISCQYRGMDFPDKELLCQGKVVSKSIADGEKTVSLHVWTLNADGKKTTPGQVTVVFDD